MNIPTPQQVAALIRPGFALFGHDLLHLTQLANDGGHNLTGVEIRPAKFYPATGGFIVEGPNEDKHYSAEGKLDN